MKKHEIKELIAFITGASSVIVKHVPNISLKSALILPATFGAI